MSGIVGFINLDREAVDPEILLQVCRPLEDRAPEGTSTWQRGSAGLGHALLAIPPESTVSSQPLSLDDRSWLTSDAHLYNREELVRKLRAAGYKTGPEVTDPALVLLAYRVFGDAFAQHLAGDFAVAIWDEDRKRLICVRDHLGVRPLFYAHSKELFIFGSDINALLAHPGVSHELDEDCVADLLLFGSPIEPGATVYKNVRRLPAAHYLVVDANGLRMHTYWTPPLHHSIRYSRDAEYTEHFAELFEQAVTARMPSTQVALELTGGMDSSSIAAVAAAHARQNGQQITAYTNTCSTLIPEDREGEYAQAIASRLNIPLHFFASEDYPLFDRFDSRELRTAEPFGNPDLAQHYDKLIHMVDSGCRVLLTGQLGDMLFAGSSTYFPHLLMTGRWFRLAVELRTHKRNVGSLRGTCLRSGPRGAINKIFGKKPFEPGFPDWLNPEFAARVKLEERWHASWQLWSDLNDLRQQFQRPWFSGLFEDYEALALPLVVRHPFCDVRLVEFMLGIPNYMHENKRALREAMQGRLPEEILARPKQNLPGDLRRAKMTTGLLGQVPPMAAAQAFVDQDRYILARETFLQERASGSTWGTWLINYPIALAFWMNNNSCAN